MADDAPLVTLGPLYGQLMGVRELRRGVFTAHVLMPDDGKPGQDHAQKKLLLYKFLGEFATANEVGPMWTPSRANIPSWFLAKARIDRVLKIAPNWA